MWWVPRSLLIKAVKHMSAELRMFQFSFLNSSQERIIASTMNWEISSLKNESWKINFIILRAWILLSALKASLASFRRKVRVVLSSTGSSLLFSTPFFLFQLLFDLMMPGSALKIAIIVGGIPADRRRTVLWDSFEIRSSVRSSIYLGKCEKIGTTKRRPTKVSKLSAVISIAPLCLN